MFGGYNSIYYEVIASQTSTNCNRLTWRDVVNVKYFCHITVYTITSIFCHNISINKCLANSFTQHDTHFSTPLQFVMAEYNSQGRSSFQQPDLTASDSSIVTTRPFAGQREWPSSYDCRHRANSPFSIIIMFVSFPSILLSPGKSLEHCEIGYMLPQRIAI